MKIKTVNEEELMNMSYDDIAYIILKEYGKKIKITDLFKKICEILNLSDNEYEAKIADFFTMIITEKRFIQLDKGYCDLRENHTKKIVIDEEEIEDDEEDLIPEENNEDLNAEETSQNYYDDLKDTEDDTEDDDLKDLVIMDDEDMEENIM